MMIFRKYGNISKKNSGGTPSTFFDRIIGEIGLGDSRVDALMLAWSVDEDFWVRRIAIDHQLLRKERTNTELLEQILVNNLGSHEIFYQQGDWLESAGLLKDRPGVGTDIYQQIQGQNGQT